MRYLLPVTDDLKDAASIEAADRKYVMRPWTHPKGEPVIIAKAKNCTVTDVHGKEYLDLTAGYFVNNAGHCHPKVIEAATKQLHTVLQVSGKHGTVPVVKNTLLIDFGARSITRFASFTAATVPCLPLT